MKSTFLELSLIGLSLFCGGMIVAETNPILAANWTLTDSLTEARLGHTATILSDGSVLVVGGWGGGKELCSSEIYDPHKLSWIKTSDLKTERMNHTATLMPNGRVLVVGGQAHGRALASAEIYDPFSKSWKDTGKLHLGRCFHTATLLSDGKVLVVGGSHEGSPPAFPQGAQAGSALDVTEIYDPASGKWTVADSLHVARYVHCALLLKNGEVLVSGGLGANGFNDVLNSVELYNPLTKVWTTTGSLLSPLIGHTTTLLPSGEVLAAGGKPTMTSDSLRAELYDPAKGTWRGTENLHIKRNAHTATLLPDGNVLVVGGAADSSTWKSAELYNPSTESWQNAGKLNQPHTLHTATLLNNGQVIVVGGAYAVGSPDFIEATSEVYYAKAATSPSKEPTSNNLTAPSSNLPD